jgi:broad specificity phosphatase PhoE
LKRVARFWENRICPLRRTDAIVLLVTHGAVITGILRYLRSQNYRIHDSIKRSEVDWDKTAKHCSITEVALDFDGLGEIITVGAMDHLLGFKDFAYHWR